ncbi:helix-turn-helix domain-containing protein [Streptomyces sp. MUM 16J]|uniref:helix-turn-helix domain-containing protein n=1 Tax=Streptomyces sp. MUM 16J TaxID=2791988 RepID=UPI001F03D56D|nr:helix-turn-helix transcriptional regulator [Streptomyces sp. MUM 16J]MCH0555830.1 helix-turn-helix transcriptional regulator [Streptomyces sp. MUM 16J]
MQSHLPDNDKWLTEERVFLAVPVSRSFYQEIEAGIANPSLDMLLRIARVIGVPIADLLRYTDIQTRD